MATCILHVSPDTSFSVPRQPVSLWVWSHILEWAGKHLSRKNSTIPRHNWKRQTEMGKDRKSRDAQEHHRERGRKGRVNASHEIDRS